ncbi:MAG TPA: pyridoxamine 5'-phosphate oxidase family protein [Candidatus Dormibacteraeota bacterium]|nr:pyridoxamine 5'-phosphate oxidase family protein [Candidatus Dormibacteraeota bacterium]
MTEPSVPIPTDRVRVRRKPERGHYDRSSIDAILDAALVGHVGYVIDGQPFVTPTGIWRQGDSLYWHGSSASRMLRATKEGIAVCVTVTQVDALVLARSGFDHSFDYRSVMLLGRAHEVTDEAEKTASLEAFVEHLYPGRWAELRPPTSKELKATSVLAMPIEEASAKIRDIGAHDEPGDETWPAWAGTFPVRVVVGDPRPDEHVREAIPPPELAGWLAGR